VAEAVELVTDLADGRVVLARIRGSG